MKLQNFWIKIDNFLLKKKNSSKQTQKRPTVCGVRNLGDQLRIRNMRPGILRNKSHPHLTINNEVMRYFVKNQTGAGNSESTEIISTINL